MAYITKATNTTTEGNQARDGVKVLRPYDTLPIDKLHDWSWDRTLY